jgi:hypothetical protein
MITDNKGLLTQIEMSLPFPEPFPKITLLSNWDVTCEIAQSLRLLARPPTLLNVQGHQDDNTQHDDLALDAQLNADADAEAGYYQCMHPSQRPIIPLLPLI